MKLQKFTALFALLFILLSPFSVFADELAERANIKNEVATLLLSQNFSKLESMANAYRTSKSRTSSGLWHLTLFYSGISSAFRAKPEFWAQEETMLEKWAAEYPESASARLAYALMLSSHGWSIRGGGYAQTVKPENWKPFKEYFERARVHLEKYKTVASKDPNWYEQMAVIAYVQDWPETEFEKLISEGIQREPLFYQIYFAAIDYYAPKWRGSSEAVEKFARRALQKTSANEGFGMYARTYWYASQTQYGNDLFSDSLVDWPTMKKGIDDVLKKYPDSWNINNFAKFACLFGDKAKTASLLSQIADSPMIGVWQQLSYFENCKLWSSDVLPASNKPLKPTAYRGT